jgi:hypothetical protein
MIHERPRPDDDLLRVEREVARGQVTACSRSRKITKAVVVNVAALRGARASHTAPCPLLLWTSCGRPSAGSADQCFAMAKGALASADEAIEFRPERAPAESSPGRSLSARSERIRCARLRAALAQLRRTYGLGRVPGGARAASSEVRSFRRVRPASQRLRELDGSKGPTARRVERFDPTESAGRRRNHRQWRPLPARRQGPGSPR